MSPYFLMALTPVALIAFSALGAKRMKLRAGPDLGLKAPAPGPALAWLAAFAVLCVATEYLSDLLGIPSEAGAWRDKYDGAQLLVRIAFVGFFYPVAEEVFFRGFVFGRVQLTRGPYAAIAVSALFFAIVHLQYDWRSMLLIAIDGCFYGLCRWRTGSVFVTMLLHIAGNSYAIWQRLH